jgi:hypothetical protein
MLEVRSRVSVIASENQITIGNTTSASKEELSESQKEWISEIKKLIQITRSVTSSAKNSQLQRDSRADGSFIRDFLHPFLYYTVSQIEELSSTQSSWNMHHMLDQFCKNTAGITLNYAKGVQGHFK